MRWQRRGWGWSRSRSRPSSWTPRTLSRTWKVRSDLTWPDLTVWQPVSSLVYVVFSDFLLSQLSHLNFTIEFSAWSLLCSEFIQHWLSLRWKEAKWDKWDRSDYSCQMSLIVFLALHCTGPLLNCPQSVSTRSSFPILLANQNIVPSDWVRKIRRGISSLYSARQQWGPSCHARKESDWTGQTELH